MKIDIYQSTKNSKKFLSVKSGQDVAIINVPDPDYQSVSPSKLGVEISPEQPRVGLDIKEAITAIETQGYYLHGVSISFSEK